MANTLHTNKPFAFDAKILYLEPVPLPQDTLTFLYECSIPRTKYSFYLGTAVPGITNEMLIWSTSMIHDYYNHESQINTPFQTFTNNEIKVTFVGALTI